MYNRHQHSALMSKLKAIEDSQEALGIDHESKLIDIQDAILRVIKEKNEKDKSVQESKRQRWEEEKAQKAEEIKAKKTRQERCEAAEERAKVRKRIERTEKDKQIAFHLEQHISLKMKLKALEREHKTSLQYVRVIDSLYFPEVRRRFFQIPLADQLSNEWIFDSKATTFIPWLESDAPGDRLFYIYGKVCVQVPTERTVSSSRFKRLAVANQHS